MMHSILNCTFKAIAFLCAGCAVYIAISPKMTVDKEAFSRNDLSEKDIDEMLKESFPASDTPSTY